MTPKLVQPAELLTPHLGQVERAALLLALNSVILGIGKVTVSLTYTKQTATRKRIAGRDYVAMPGVDKGAFIGDLTLVARNKAKGHVFFYVPSLTRADGSRAWGPTNLLPPESCRSW